MASILIVDDERAIRNSLKDILEFENHKVELAEHGVEGLEKLKTQKFDIVFSDIKMPHMDGIEFLKAAMEERGEIPIIMISGHATIDIAVEAIKHGAYD
ncbi:MAG TPA: response regulator, partial [Bacteroidales bacterium]|nr:response regulator [Bacteroidales bacterium]